MTNYYNVLIRVCKGLDNFETKTIIQETIKAENKEEVKKIILEKYPQLFPNSKIYSRTTKDEAQFFYVLIYEHSSYSLNELNKKWTCDYCNKEHLNKIEHKPVTSNKFPNKFFCNGGNPKRLYPYNDNYKEYNSCLKGYEEEFYKTTPLEDDKNFVFENSSYFIYKITEKNTGKSYIGQTRNAPFFRWWQHLRHSSTPFGIYFSRSNLSDWTFEVLEELQHNINHTKVLERETYHILKYNSVENGFNTVISKKND